MQSIKKLDLQNEIFLSNETDKYKIVKECLLISTI